MNPEKRLPRVHKLKLVDQMKMDELCNPESPIVMLARPKSIGEDVMRGDKLLIVDRGVDLVRSIVQVTDKILFLKR